MKHRHLNHEEYTLAGKAALNLASSAGAVPIGT